MPSFLDSLMISQTKVGSHSFVSCSLAFLWFHSLKFDGLLVPLLCLLALKALIVHRDYSDVFSLLATDTLSKQVGLYYLTKECCDIEELHGAWPYSACVLVKSWLVMPTGHHRTNLWLQWKYQCSGKLRCAQQGVITCIGLQLKSEFSMYFSAHYQKVVLVWKYITGTW